MARPRILKAVIRTVNSTLCRRDRRCEAGVPLLVRGRLAQEGTSGEILNWRNPLLDIVEIKYRRHKEVWEEVPKSNAVLCYQAQPSHVASEARS